MSECVCVRVCVLYTHFVYLSHARTVLSTHTFSSLYYSLHEMRNGNNNNYHRKNNDIENINQTKSNKKQRTKQNKKEDEQNKKLNPK